ncbi:MAG: LAGLIDADG family homing endonuclease [Candidatus Diapherotrites archaeon]|nr:LAGLIDADG family homing endonuclease [Candidatus Micrarchaeota archaeon]MBU1939251.1 LAGLIDADG family homing endonuclease [Candidatus Micrarchaeota archaeon]
MISDDYIMGFVEGEGCFSIGIQRYIDRKPRKTSRKNKRKHKAFPIRIMPSFRIVIREKDRRVLEEIKEKFGFGFIQWQKKTGNHQNVCHYVVENFADVFALADFFSRQTFYTQKGEDFRKWTQALEIIKSGGHLTKEGALEICKLRDGMNSTGRSKKTRNPRLFDEVKALLEEKREHILAHTDENQTQLLHNTEGVLPKWLLPTT